MTLSSDISTTSTALSDIKSAIIAKGVTPSGNITTYATAISNIPTGGGGGKYQLLQRISDDNENEIGTVSGFFTDANNVEYAVVCLDAQYRLKSGQFSSSTGAVTNLPQHSSNLTLYSASETATINTQLIIDWCLTNSYTSSACSHCRSNSFIIDGVTYYGQLPNIVEVIDIFRHIELNSLSPVPVPKIYNVLSSSQYDDNYVWYLSMTGTVSDKGTKTSKFNVFPVLEISNH